jgi:hypothetical protein
MQVLTQAELLGFVEVRVGSITVQVPIRAASSIGSKEIDSPVAKFVAEDDTYAILVQGDAASAPVQRAVREAAREAERHLSRKLLN